MPNQIDPMGPKQLGRKNHPTIYIYIILFFGEAPRVILFKTNNNQK